MLVAMWYGVGLVALVVGAAVIAAVIQSCR
jgi:hypothetical protein